MSVHRFVARRAARALIRWKSAARLARILDGSPVSRYADNDAVRMARRLARWRFLEDLTAPEVNGSES